MKLKKLKNNEVESEILKYFNKPEYNIVYINYEKEFGIKIVKEGKDLFEKNDNRKLKLKDFNDFYRVYIFNEKKMVTIYKFSDEDYRISEIEYNYDENSEKVLNYNILKEREIYLELELDKDNSEKTKKVEKKEFKIKIQIIKENLKNGSIEEEKSKEKMEILKFVKFLD